MANIHRTELDELQDSRILVQQFPKLLQEQALNLQAQNQQNMMYINPGPNDHSGNNMQQQAYYSHAALQQQQMATQQFQPDLTSSSTHVTANVVPTPQAHQVQPTLQTQQNIPLMTTQSFQQQSGNVPSFEPIQRAAQPAQPQHNGNGISWQPGAFMPGFLPNTAWTIAVPGQQQASCNPQIIQADQMMGISGALQSVPSAQAAMHNAYSPTAASIMPTQGQSQDPMNSSMSPAATGMQPAQLQSHAVPPMPEHAAAVLPDVFMYDSVPSALHQSLQQQMDAGQIRGQESDDLQAIMAGQRHLEHVATRMNAAIEATPRPTKRLQTEPAQSEVSSCRKDENTAVSGRHSGQGAAAGREGDGDFDGDAVDQSKAKIQEKNRLAQRRFRERQKVKAKNVNRQLDELQNQLVRLKLEKERLASSNRTLESICQSRSMEIDALNRGLVGKEMKDAPAVLTPSTSDQLKLKNEEIVDKKSVTVTVGIGDDGAQSLDPAQLQGMDPNTMFQVYKRYTTALAKLLVQLGKEGSDQQDSTMERVRQVSKEVLSLAVKASVQNPLSTRQWILHRGNPYYQFTEQEAASKMEEVLKVCQFSEQQQMDVYNARKIMLERTIGFIRERQEVASSIGEQQLPDFAHGPAVAGSFVTAHDALRRLKELMVLEHLVFVDFAYTCYVSIMTPLQYARIVVCCFPLHPDIMSITSKLAHKYCIENNLPPLHSEFHLKDYSHFTESAAKTNDSDEKSKATSMPQALANDAMT